MKPKVIATIRGKDIPKDMMEKAVKEARLIAKEALANFYDVESIMNFCQWNKTPSGLDFWDKINEANVRR